MRAVRRRAPAAAVQAQDPCAFSANAETLRRPETTFPDVLAPAPRRLPASAFFPARRPYWRGSRDVWPFCCPLPFFRSYQFPSDVFFSGRARPSAGMSGQQLPVRQSAPSILDQTTRCGLSMRSSTSSIWRPWASWARRLRRQDVRPTPGGPAQDLRPRAASRGHAENVSGAIGGLADALIHTLTTPAGMRRPNLSVSNRSSRQNYYPLT